MNMKSAMNQTFGRRIFMAPIASFLFLCGVQSGAMAQVTSASEIISALKPKPASRSLKVEDIPIPKIDLTINFEFDSSRLSPDSQIQLGELSSALNSPELADFKFSIVGHTDSVGEQAYNMRLSKQRADTVVKYLVSNSGIGGNRLFAEGKGKNQLKDASHPESAINRRVEIINVPK